MFLNECSEVNTIIRELQNIPIGVIKKSKIISPALSLVLHFNYLILMEIGKFHYELQLGKITPIYKKESDKLQ